MNLTKFERKGHIGVLMLDSPTNLNALTTQMMTEISSCLDQVEADPTIYALILTGRGRAFVAGGNIKEMVNYTAVDMMEWATLGSKLNLRLEELRVPVIAAVNGFALGGGCELAMACDIRIASETARFGQPEVGLGITPGAGGTQRLPRLVGEGRAKELLFTGAIIDAQEAYRIGLVNRVVPPDALLEQAIQLCQSILANAQLAVQQCKRLVNAGTQMDKKSAMELERQGVSLCFSTEDQKIGMTAFLQKSSQKSFVYR